MAATLEKVEKPLQVALQVAVGVDEGVAYARLSGQVADPLELLLSKEGEKPLLVGQVETEEPVPPVEGALPPLARFAGALDPRFPQAVPLQVRRVIVVDGIDAYHLPTLPQEPKGDKMTDEPGRSGNQYLHSLSPEP